MPIYAYKCSACGFAQDVLRKMSDAPLTVCPNCGASAFEKQVTAAGFQLKGSGWYVTDFRDGGGKKADAKPDASPATAADGGGGDAAKPASTGGDGAAPSPAPATAPAAAPATPAPAASPTVSTKSGD